MGSGAHWRPYADLFAHHRVIIPDARDHGRTAFTEIDLTRTNPHCLADDVVALMDALEKAALYGRSAGGNTALQVVRRYPERVKSLIVCGRNHHESEETQATLMAMGVDGPRKVNLARGQQVVPHLIAEWQQTHAQFEDHWLRLLERRPHAMFNPPLLMPPEELAAIAAPTLVIWGDRDQFLSVEQAVAVYRALPNAQLAVIPNADHFVTRTHRAQFGQLMADFLSAQALG
jgi:pimeloyl-ACP methyl ester carboxylesterase